MKNKKIGLLIGRFQPFHKGHLWLVKKMAQEVDELKIAIGSSQEKRTKKNPLSATERKEIIKKVLKANNIKKFKLYYLPDINSDARWVSYAKKRVGKFDLVYSGNPWVVRLFREKKYKVIKIKEIAGISGTKIRKLVHEKKTYKKYLPQQVFLYLRAKRLLSIFILD